MKVLTVRQPWAWAIIYGGKDVENRIRNLAGSYRGPLAIHTSLRLADGFSAVVKRILRVLGVDDAPWPNLAVGSIIGVVDLVDVHYSERNDHCSPWADPCCSHLVLRNPRPIEPALTKDGRGKPFKGKLHLWEIDDQLVLDALGVAQ